MPGELHGDSAISLRPNEPYRVQPAIPLPLVTLSSCSINYGVRVERHGGRKKEILKYSVIDIFILSQIVC